MTYQQAFNEIQRIAKEDAVTFQNEWGTAIDPETTDWDAVAYSRVPQEVRETIEANGQDPWYIYQVTLVEYSEFLND